MPHVAKVLNTAGEDIAPLINEAADRHGLDAVHLLALLDAESGLNPKAERWGRETVWAKRALATGNTADLASIIEGAWPDISFGYSQRIVLFHDVGNRTPLVANVLAVRAAVFADPAGDIDAAAKRLANGIGRSLDGTALGGMVVYNAGEDRRNDPEWMQVWAGNVMAYARALEDAAAFAVKGPTPAEEWENAINVLRGWSRQLAQASREIGDVAGIVERLRA
jgi:hypothetical protein